MSQQIELNAELREDVGKGASRRLRRLKDQVPGILYGGRRDPVNLTLKSNELVKAMQQESFYSQILMLRYNGEEQQVVVRDLQRHPASEKVQHIDFLRIRADRVITVSVPMHFINEESNAAVKSGATVSHVLNEVEISCLPGDLPEFLQLDIGELEEGQSLHLSDIQLPEGVTIVALSYGEDHDSTVVSVVAKRAAVEEEESDEAPEADAGSEEGGDESSDD